MYTFSLYFAQVMDLFFFFKKSTKGNGTVSAHLGFVAAAIK